MYLHAFLDHALHTAQLGVFTGRCIALLEFIAAFPSISLIWRFINKQGAIISGQLEPMSSGRGNAGVQSSAHRNLQTGQKPQINRP